jgi:hypothetical protein
VAETASDIRRSVNRQNDFERRPTARLARIVNGAAVGQNELLHEGKAEAAAISFCGFNKAKIFSPVGIPTPLSLIS